MNSLRVAIGTTGMGLGKRSMSSPLISIVVATYNRDRFLREALESLISQETHDDFAFELVVVDNGSTDGSGSIIDAVAEAGPVDITKVVEHRAGVARARNTGIASSKGDWIAFFDDDQVASPDWLRRLFLGAMKCHSKCVGGAVHLDLCERDLEKLSPAFRGAALREFTDRSGNPEPRPYSSSEYPGTGNALYDRSVFDHVGLFDEEMDFGGEDHDLAIRLRRAGYELWYVPDAAVKHRVFPKRLTPEYMRWDAIQGGAETAFLDQKHHGTAKVLLLGAARLLKSAVITTPCLVYAMATHDPSRQLDCRMVLRRHEGYLRGLFTIVFPRLASRDSLTERWAFRKGRDIELS